MTISDGDTGLSVRTQLNYLLDAISASASDQVSITVSASGAVTIAGTLGVTGILTASGGFDGTIGAVTPTTAVVTTLTASGALTASGGVDGVLGAVTPTTAAVTTLTASGALTATGGVDGVLGGVTPAAVTATSVTHTLAQQSGEDTGVYGKVEDNLGIHVAGSGTQNLWDLEFDAASGYCLVEILMAGQGESGLDIGCKYLVGVINTAGTTSSNILEQITTASEGSMTFTDQGSNKMRIIFSNDSSQYCNGNINIRAVGGGTPSATTANSGITLSRV